MCNLIDEDRSPLVEAHMILKGLTGLKPTIEHMRALDNDYKSQLDVIRKDLNSLNQDIRELHAVAIKVFNK